ncbi:efflux RND transporter periplasmic adaptor subunit [Geminicoccaceae bacterium 1502E]|nr:efflux RND transporter periplasmic adaptor subunit [Geminicoccaceae bacterium 1502E]
MRMVAMERAWGTAVRRGTMLLAGLLLLAGCGEGGADGSAQAAREAPPPPPVTVATPLVKRLMEWDEFTGRFEAVESVQVRARVSGYLDAVHFEDGALVEKGQLLFVIDQRPFEAAVAQTEAQVESAEARLKLAQLDLDRASKLVDSSAVSRATLDQRQAEARGAAAALDAARAQLRQARLELEFTEVRAPVAGRISSRRADVGNLVSPESLLTTIVSLDPIHFVFDMSEQDFLAYQRAVQAGALPSTRDQATPVQVRLSDEEGWPRDGAMNFVDNVVDQGTGTVRARALLDNPDHLILPGQFGTIRIPGSPEYDALLVPDAAIGTDQDRRIVMAVGEDGTVTPRIVKPGPRVFGLRIVRKGLGADDRIVIDGLIRARPGAKVTPKPGEITLPEQAG